MNRILEIRSYQLKPGQGAAFHRLIWEHSLPLLKAWGMDVVACGPSAHDPDSYFLMRSFDDLAHRQTSQDAFYGSTDWRLGPREAVIALIEQSTEAVFSVDAATLAALRLALQASHPGR